MDVRPLAAQLRRQAKACGQFGSPLYEAVLSRAAADLVAGGPTAAVLRGFEDAAEDAAMALRLAGAVHRLALTGDAPDVAAHYPSCGGDGDTDAAWRAFAGVLARQPDAVRAGLASPPQTNEVGRAAALFGGLLATVRQAALPVRLYEIGCSGGLNLRADRFAYRSADGGAWALAPSPVVLDPAWQTMPPSAPERLDVVERVGGDLSPVDVTTDDGAVQLLSYVWPDQRGRIARLRAAVEVARRYPVRLRRCTALELVEGVRLVDGAVTVVWHSVMWQYVDGAEQRAVLGRLSSLGEQADRRKPFVHLAFEPGPRGTIPFLVTATTWPGGSSVTLGQAPPHGVPVEWAGVGNGTS